MNGKPAPLDDPRAFMEWLVSRAGSQAELARRAGLLSSTISDYVRGENEPGLRNILKMMRAAEARLDGAPLQQVAAAEEELAIQVARLRRLNDAYEGAAEPPRQARTRQG